MNKKRSHEGIGNGENGLSSHKKQKVELDPHISARQTASSAKALNFQPSTPPSSNPTNGNPKDQLPQYQKPAQPYNGHPSTLPPLPPINSPSLASTAFTHAAYYPGTTASKLHSTYDRLEFLGDAYIEIIATRLIYRLFPNLPAGRMSQRRELCVKNETLAKYAVAYGFDKRARLPAGVTREQRGLWVKTMGDVFEAYVAGVVLGDPEGGFERVEGWLGGLWEWELGREQGAGGVEGRVVRVEAKNELQRMVGGRRVRVEYRDEKAPESIREQGKVVYHIGVFLTGWDWRDRHLGSGSGLSKQEAGAVAAEEALGNPLMGEITRVKREYDAQVAAAREKGEEPLPFVSRLEGK